ncbi:hypothetical protein LTS18_006790 [Coniosporium uncinatum]|uniref:Uncharacterized protein n=1 Tax=Coniosporium uncinatum TaxID=93489 RepID=A0ACC3DAV0_9PEZI|nr:hypothetical protein LTS18_006790 [Coniosporium uncinatum]
MAAVLSVQATPGGLYTVNLDNGNSTVTTSAEIQYEARSILDKRDEFNCKGSSLCSNGQGFKNQCQNAYNRIEDTTYNVGGAKSGTCDGNCGIFLQGANGQSCPVGATGQDLRNAYNAIRGAGCQACGSVINGACQVTINYVTGC